MMLWILCAVLFPSAVRGLGHHWRGTPASLRDTAALGWFAFVILAHLTKGA